MKAEKAGILLKDILRKITGVSLFMKVMGIALFLIALQGIGAILETRALMRDLVNSETEEQTQFLARHLEALLPAPLITGDTLAVLELLKEPLEIYPDLRYLFVVSPGGRVISSTLALPLSRELVEANGVKAGGRLGLELLDTEDGLINDIAVPILDGKLGTLRAGFAQNRMRRAVNGMAIRLAASVLLVALIGVGISYLLASILNRPISTLMQGVAQVERGDFGVRVVPWFDDEIGRLAAAFNNMAGALGRERALKTELMRKLITTQEEERLRISRELHDKTSQSLTSIKIGLKVLETQALPREAAANLEQLRTILNTSLDGIHELAVELRPPALGDLGLPRIIEELGESFRKTFKIDVYCAIDGYFADNRLKPEVEIGLYRIIQEAFSNVEKHSGASKVWVNFIKTAAGLQMTVKDNGRGFDPGPPLNRPGRKPIGLFGMRERAEILGGKFSIQSSGGRGTELTIYLPLECL